MRMPGHGKVISRIPGYVEGEEKANQRKIKELMAEYGYDEDEIEAVNPDFCRGFGIARDIIVEMLKMDEWRDR